MRTHGSHNISVVGATGLVGETLLRVLEERRFRVDRLRLYAGERSAGARVKAFGGEHDVLDISQFAGLLEPGSSDDAPLDVVFFASGADVSQTYARAAAHKGALVIDKSSAFRLEPEVPLAIPEINAAAMLGQRLISNPNCAVIPLAITLFPILSRFGLQWVSVSTYQSVSGAGRRALEEMQAQEHGVHAAVAALPRRIAGNVIPENGCFDEDGHGDEERKIAAELRKLMSCPELRVSATSVRVPVRIGHAEALSFCTLGSVTREQLREVLREAPGVRFLDGDAYATPLDVAGTDDVVVGRLRPDLAHPGAFMCWVVCDNLRKGAATNAVQIAETALNTCMTPA